MGRILAGNCRRPISPGIRSSSYLYPPKLRAVICRELQQNLVDLRQSEIQTSHSIYHHSIMQEAPDIYGSSNKVLAIEPEKVLESKNIGLLRPSSLKKVLNHPKLHVSEEGKVFTALISWGLVQLTAEKNETPRRELENKMNMHCTAEKTQGDGDNSAKELLDNDKKKVEVEAPSEIKCCTEEPSVSPLRQVVGEFLPLVRYLLMTSNEFVRCVLPSGVLYDGESLAILQRIEDSNFITLPDFVSVLASNKRERVTKSCLVYDRKFNIDENLSSKYNTACCAVLLLGFKISKPIFLIRISSPCISSLQEGGVNVQNSTNEEIGKGTWKGVHCQFKRPISLVPDETYTVKLSIKNSLTVSSGKYNDFKTEHEGVNFVGKTICCAQVEIEYFVNN